MKAHRLLAVAATLAAASSTPALALPQQPDQDKMKANFAEMQHHDWYTQGGWTVDFEAAKAESKRTGKPIFAYFTRTYAP